MDLELWGVQDPIRILILFVDQVAIEPTSSVAPRVSAGKDRELHLGLWRKFRFEHMPDVLKRRLEKRKSVPSQRNCAENVVLVARQAHALDQDSCFESQDLLLARFEMID